MGVGPLPGRTADFVVFVVLGPLVSVDEGLALFGI